MKCDFCGSQPKSWISDIGHNFCSDECLGKWNLRDEESRVLAIRRLAEAGSPPKKEMVNHPEHYNRHPSGVECIQIIQHFGFNVGSAMKHLWRAGLKTESSLEDLQKAKRYIDFEIERVQGRYPVKR